jgi:hypothetical protein
MALYHFSVQVWFSTPPHDALALAGAPEYVVWQFVSLT